MDRKVKTLLVYPPITTYGSDSPAGVALPIGLAYLAAVLEKEGHHVKVLDAVAEGGVMQRDDCVRVGMSQGEIRNYIVDYGPDIVGISSMFTPYAQDAHEVARVAKQVDPETLVVFGGTHASCNYDMVLKDKNVDVIVKGEGEITLSEIVRAKESGIEPKEIAGTIVRDNGGIHFNAERPYISDLDYLPFPARHLLDMERYINATSPYRMRRPHAVLISSRGCPKKCIYCSIHSVWGNRWRARSAKNVVDEIEYLVKTYGIKEIHFNDDNISIDKRRMHQICDEMIKRSLDIKWTTPNGIASWTLDRELIHKMKKAGCYRLTFGIETGTQAMQRYIGKNLNLDHARQIIRWANQEGLWTICTHIIGFPYETEKEMNDTVNYAISSDTDFALFYTLTPFRGTKIYQIFDEAGLIPQDPSEYRNFLVTEYACKTRHFSSDEIQQIQNSAYRKFMFNRLKKNLLNPFRILKKIDSVESLFYVFRLGSAFINININLARFKQMGARVLYERNKQT